MPDNVHIFGIRHHGPGSARSLKNQLESLNPDCILIEGPPEAEAVLTLAAHPGMKPPVALLVYDPEQPQRGGFYPFAVFSPEWQAIQHGLSRQVPVRFIDLPQSIQMAVSSEAPSDKKEPSTESPADTAGEYSTDSHEETGPEKNGGGSGSETSSISDDPLAYLATAAGYTDAESWWEQMVENRCGDHELFAAIREGMTALRRQFPTPSDADAKALRELRREAWMRQSIRGAIKDGYRRIAVVCGAWHAPALEVLPPAKEDAALLKGLPKTKVTATWIPWTYSRLSFQSGYGAGVESPGWYHFLWELRAKPLSDSNTASDLGARMAGEWLVQVARLLRGEGIDASSASVIEAVRLAESLASLRGRPLPGLRELNEATQTVLCLGESLPLRMISDKLIIGERLGTVPDSTPMVPLARDLAQEQKRLRLPPESLPRQIDLDLRKPNDLDRSRLLHRLNLLGIPWGEANRPQKDQRGTFHEFWNLQWEPEFAVLPIEAAVWGNTVPSAATAKARARAGEAPDLSSLTSLLETTLLADLPQAAETLVQRLQVMAAVASDVGQMMDALPPLAHILRYGNVRKTDSDMVAHLVDGLVARICVGLPGACGSLNDEAAEAMLERLQQTHDAVQMLQNPSHVAEWNRDLETLSAGSHFHGLVSGRATRLLLETDQIPSAEAAHRFGLALSTANPVGLTAAWIDGFLRNSGIILLHDEKLWSIVDRWITALSPDQFTQSLPLLRRTFSSFAVAERRQLGERSRQDGVSGRRGISEDQSFLFDATRANRALPVLAELLGIKMENIP